MLNSFTVGKGLCWAEISCFLGEGETVSVKLERPTSSPRSKRTSKDAETSAQVRAVCRASPYRPWQLQGAVGGVGGSTGRVDYLTGVHAPVRHCPHGFSMQAWAASGHGR